MKRHDFIAEARAVLADQMRAGTADSDVNTMDEILSVRRGLLQWLIEKAETLGANTMTFREIQESIKHGPSA